jgi:ribose transport system permease protein
MSILTKESDYHDLLTRIKSIIKNKELLYASILVVIIFSIFAPRFFSLDNISNILMTASIGGVLSLGLSFVMMGGDFDLSFATACGLLNVINMILLNYGFNMYLVFIISILLGIVWQLFNACLIVKIKIHAFIATIATLNIAKGFIYWITKGQTFYGKYPPAITIISRTMLLKVIPVCACIFAFLGVIAYLIGNHTKYGRYLYAIGSNSDAARYVGIKVDVCRIKAFILNGIFMGIAAIMLSSRLTSAPATGGDGYQMTVIGAAFLGATVFRLGVVNIGGSILSILLLVIVDNGLVMLNVPFYYQYLVQGLIIISAVSFISFRNRKGGMAGKGPAIM